MSFSVLDSLVICEYPLKLVYFFTIQQESGEIRKHLIWLLLGHMYLRYDKKTLLLFFMHS